MEFFINQSKYTKEMLKTFFMETSSSSKTPMSTTIKLDKDKSGKCIDITVYRGMIGSLLYLTASRPDIMFSACLYARFKACPKKTHLHAVKGIFKYLHGTLNLGIWYPRNVDPRLLGYSDAGYASCL
ncbi:uncharacterized mitochondrial protein AtMg00240-like [Mercurialis annua]|uniref:uncharacterized mitochondrial protein AtMg00240-like n=1 Tax=Mercurialis annua TaxID=3986 RepID=UPI00216019BC|nr:uncharacterized mitochondrial protein AtMg00240-like [Mercurialis annua]